MSSPEIQIDLRLLPPLGLLYCINFLDRVNIGNAKIEGMDKDLGLTGVQYNVALCIFFISYILLGTRHRFVESIVLEV